MEAANSDAFSRPNAKRYAAQRPARGQGLRGVARRRRYCDGRRRRACARANDDEEHDDHAADAAGDHVGARLRILARANALFDEAGLQIEELPGRDGGADQGREHQQICRVELHVGITVVLRREQPIGLRQNGREQYRPDKTCKRQKDFLDLPVGAAQNQNPDDKTREGHGNIAADAENLHGRRHAGKFGDHVAQIHQKPVTITKNVGRKPNSSRIRSESPCR